MGSHVLWLDWESFSKVDLKKRGADVYLRDVSTEGTLLGWAIDNGPVQLWDVAQTSYFEWPHELYAAFTSPDVIKRAYNAPFDRGIFIHVLKQPSPVEEWQCAQVLAYSLAFAGRLKEVLAAFNIENKDTAGDAMIRRFCTPQKESVNVPARWTHRNDPEGWKNFGAYAVQDVRVLRTLWKRCEEYEPMSDMEWQLWHLDQKINARGMPIDLHLVDKAMKAAHKEKLQLAKDIRRITGMTSIGPKPLAHWLGLPNMQKETKERAYAVCTPGTNQREVLRLELLRSQTSVSKWDAFMNRTDPVDRVLRGTLQMNGAGRTRRWAGRGVQVHNLKRTTADMDADIKLILEEQ